MPNMKVFFFSCFYVEPILLFARETWKISRQKKKKKKHLIDAESVSEGNANTTMEREKQMRQTWKPKMANRRCVVNILEHLWRKISLKSYNSWHLMEKEQENDTKWNIYIV